MVLYHYDVQNERLSTRKSPSTWDSFHCQARQRQGDGDDSDSCQGSREPGAQRRGTEVRVPQEKFPHPLPKLSAVAADARGRIWNGHNRTSQALRQVRYKKNPK